MLAVYAAYAGQHGGRTVARPAHEPEALIQFDELLLTVIATALCLAVGLSCAGTLLNAHAPRHRGARDDYRSRLLGGHTLEELAGAAGHEQNALEAVLGESVVAARPPAAPSPAS